MADHQQHTDSCGCSHKKPNKKITQNGKIESISEDDPNQKAWWWKTLGLFILIGSIIGGSSIGVLANFVPP